MTTNAVRTFGQQKAGLTRASKVGDARSQERYDAVLAECKRTVAEWGSPEWAAAHRVRQGAWPDDWARWQRALDDAHPSVFGADRLEDI